MKGQIRIDGYKFSNEHEYKRYLGLMELIKSGRLQKLYVKEKYPLVINEIEVDSYAPTFKFYDPAKNEERFIQVMSGVVNQILELRIRLFEAIYGFHVERWG